ncbi:hypothetical protein BJY01DRAFT_215835 [Aspergillus pseudoustus]|uniref:Uncharacterized protein n=1 Tax=Aspergillus pseudoustus TaxID=1810923 RepID=A0ABR4JWF9_9EURO
MREKTYTYNEWKTALRKGRIYNKIFLTPGGGKVLSIFNLSYPTFVNNNFSI